MKIRKLITGAIALALVSVGAHATSAKADDDFDRDVGGGVAAIQAEGFLGSGLLNVVNKQGVDATVVYGRAVMGATGGNVTSKLLDTTVGPVSVKAAYENIHGNRSGLPQYAAGRSVLTGLTIGSAKLRALDVSCLWDRSGASGSTTVVDANGTSSQPAINKTTVIPGLGTLVFNEQYVNTLYKYDPTLAGPPYYSFRPYQVIYVFGAHLYLEANAQQAYGVADVILGFTSCDPTTLPSITALKLVAGGGGT